MLFCYALKHGEHITTALAPGTYQQNARVGTGLKTPYVAEVQVQRDQKSSFGNNSLPDRLVAGAGEPLIMNTVGFVATSTQILQCAP